MLLASTQKPEWSKPTMTRVILNGTIKGLSGRLGNLIFRQMPDGTTVVTQAKPKKNSRQKRRAKERRSDRQKAHNERFSDASSYGKVYQTNPVYIQLAKVTPMHTAYNFAVSEWWHAPEILRIERKGKYIRVEATDNIQVTRVRVTLLDKDGKVLERGKRSKVKETGGGIRRKQMAGLSLLKPGICPITRPSLF